MPVSCPRCCKANPTGSAYCWFDGGSLLSGDQGTQRLVHDFIFPSGRRCPTLEDFAQACYDEWAVARDLLSKDAFRQFFTALGRVDLVRISAEAMQQSNPDVRLSQFVDGLPVARVQRPKLDVHPRRFTLGRIPAGDVREIELTLTNLGPGTIQGTVTLAEGSDFLSFPDSPERSQLRVQTAKEQRLRIKIDASKLQAAQSYTGLLIVVTSGGVAEVPVRFELVARPFAKAPFQGVRTPRELAERMRSHPKQAGPLLESGDIARWFSTNNWNYPVQGEVAKGIAGVQQFFEAMGLSRPPQLSLSQKDLRFTAHYPDPVRFQVAVQTASRKWVYGQVTSDQPWMKVLTPRVIGPQHANVLLEADPTRIERFPPEECCVRVVGNGGQKLDLRVNLDVRDVPRPSGPGRWKPVMAFALLFLAMRLALIPVIDFHARGSAAASAAARLDLPIDASLSTPAGSLALPWVAILAGADTNRSLGIPSDTPESSQQARDFRTTYIAAFLRRFMAWTWWIVPAFAAAFVLRRSDRDWRDVVPALIAGGALGVLIAASLACLVLIAEVPAHIVWSLIFNRSSNPAMLPIWFTVSAGAWAAFGSAIGFVLAVFRIPTSLVASIKT